MRVQINPAALASTGLSLEDVRTFLGQVAVDQPKGSLDGEQTSYTLTSNDQLIDAREFRPLILVQRHNVPIKLSALGKIVQGIENARLAGWAGTRRAVLLIVFKEAGANVIETVDRIKAELPRIEQWIPPSVKISVLSDRTTTIRSSVADVATVSPGQYQSRGDGDFPVPAAAVADVHRQRDRAVGAGRHVRHHVPAALQRGQPVVDGDHHLRRIRGR